MIDADILIKLLSIILTAILAYYFALKQSAASKQQEIAKEHKYQYFLPFKYQAEELLNRSIHIEQRLTEGQKEMKAHFRLALEDKHLDWYFIDWQDVPAIISGGYFLASTVYMHCLMYNKMYALQEKFPYMQVLINDSLENENANDVRFSRYLGSGSLGLSQINDLNNPNDWVKMHGAINFKKAVHAVRVSTVMRHNEGIPYALHYSFGDFVSDRNGGIINYEQFCKLLNKEEERVKFSPLINFWNGMVDTEGNVHTARLNKLRTLIIALKLVEACDLK